MATKTTPACATCMYFADPAQGYGLCQRNPPVMVNAPFNGHMASPAELERVSFFPGVADGAWCGEYAKAPVAKTLPVPLPMLDAAPDAGTAA